MFTFQYNRSWCHLWTLFIFPDWTSVGTKLKIPISSDKALPFSRTHLTVPGNAHVKSLMSVCVHVCVSSYLPWSSSRFISAHSCVLIPLLSHSAALLSKTLLVYSLAVTCPTLLNHSADWQDVGQMSELCCDKVLRSPRKHSISTDFMWFHCLLRSCKRCLLTPREGTKQTKGLSVKKWMFLWYSCLFLDFTNF